MSGCRECITKARGTCSGKYCTKRSKDRKELPSANDTAKARDDWRGGLSEDVATRRRDSGVSSHMKLFTDGVAEDSDAMKQYVLGT